MDSTSLAGLAHARLQWGWRALRLTIYDPTEGLDRARERLRRRDRASVGDGDAQVDRHLHEALGLPWPCEEHDRFAAIAAETTDELRALGLETGRGAYGGWDDADPAFARAIWCLVLHLAPRRVVETGVARGVTSRVILEALATRGNGHLWSIDLPPLDRELHSEIGAAVPSRLRDRWTLVQGTSRRRLPELLRQVGPIDMFVHDSLHTERNLRFELVSARRALSPGGALVADDVERNDAFARFLDGTSGVHGWVGAADDGRSRFGVAVLRDQLPADREVVPT